MVKHSLHVYLSESPDEDDIGTLLEFYGLSLIGKRPSTGQEPDETHWEWSHPPLSDAGFKLIYFHGLCQDDLFTDQYGRYIILEGPKFPSQIDLAFMDILTKFLIDRYGGIIRNPHRGGEDCYLSGAVRAA